VRRADTDETDRRLHQTVGLVVVSGSAAVIWALWTISRNGGWLAGPWLRILGVAVMLSLASRIVLQIRIKSSQQSVNVLDAIILLGLMLIPGSWLVLITAVVVTVAWVAKKVSPIKILFNAGKGSSLAGAAVLVAWSLGVRGPFLGNPHGLHLVAIIAAAATIAVVDEAFAIPVIALATHTPVGKLFRANLDVRLGGMVVRLALAILVMVGLTRQPALVVLAPLVMLCLQVVAVNQVRERAERDAWQKLAQTTDEFNEVSLDSVLTSAVSRAAELFSADEVEVHVAGAPISERLVRGDSKSIKYDGPQLQAPTRAGQVIDVPLRSHDGSADVGALRLRFFGKVKLTEREEYTLKTFAAALCTAIRNAAAFTESQRLSAEHEHAATHDPLTGLANRRQLYQTGATLLAQRPNEGLVGLLLVDLNHFKEVNDTLGHAAGDKVLIEVGRRLTSAAQPGDLLVRLGGDEFAVLFVGLPAPALAVPRARTVLAALDLPMEIDGMRLVIEASAGVALAPSRGGIQELLRRADVAMYQSKRSGQPVAVYARSRDTADIGRLALSADLPRAVAEHEFTVNFQPIVDLASGEVISTEALARWHHPDRGDLNPTRFLDSVERSGMLAAFSEAVLEQALRAAATWRAAGFELPVAVNVSPRSLLDPRFPEAVQERLERAQVPAEVLTIELTESLTLSQLDVVDEVLCALRDQGIRLALDDFGTGYSSLATLARVPVHELKIDRAFVAAMDSSSADAAVVRSTIELGRSLDLLVVAEGVESEEQRRRLWEQGCPAGQGHLFGRPMPVHRLLAALRRGYGGKPATLAAPLHESGAVIRLDSRRSQHHRRDELG
jgi:diguanylate cyclase (GGDEF)-like protein